MTVSIAEAQQNLEALIMKAVEGEKIVVTIENQAFEITATKKKTRGGWGSLPGWKMSDDFNAPLEEFKEYME
ncbi:MAG: hypothetical protein RLZZ156_1156 [Deinococcota bacterium]|jgi:antitoxin (DNA-binding transcriptional repressor) of toxin-antitoxin stability system